MDIFIKLPVSLDSVLIIDLTSHNFVLITKTLKIAILRDIGKREGVSRVQTDATLLYVTCCCVFLGVVAQSLKLVKRLSQLLPTFLLFRDRRTVAQQRWIRLHSSSNIGGATHAHYTWSRKSYGLYLSYDALQVPTLLDQQCWELLRPSARSLSPLIAFCTK